MTHKNKIGCLFGSFNPIHSGHIHLAEIVLGKTIVDEVWFVISPQNPFKVNKNIVDENLRKEMVELMTEGDYRLKTCDIEFDLPRPSYTYTTIEELNNKYPENEFHFIIGSDALNSIEKWVNYEKIVKMPIIGFIRDNEHIDDNIQKIINDLTITHSNSNSSSTFVRNYINLGKIDDLEKLKLLNEKTIEYIKEHELYNYKKYIKDL